MTILTKAEVHQLFNEANEMFKTGQIDSKVLATTLWKMKHELLRLKGEAVEGKLTFTEALEYINENPKAVLTTSDNKWQILHKRGYHICNSYAGSPDGDEYIGGVPLYIRGNLMSTEWFDTGMDIHEVKAWRKKYVAEGGSIW